MKAIETYYNGYRFRSRLEARWAVFFDRIGIQYEYEPEGFELSNKKRYLPDFYLPDLNIYVEVKPAEKQFIRICDVDASCEFVGNEAKKYQSFAEDCVKNGFCAWFVFGDPMCALFSENIGENGANYLFCKLICILKILNTEKGGKCVCGGAERIISRCRKKSYAAVNVCMLQHDFAVTCDHPKGTIPESAKVLPLSYLIECYEKSQNEELMSDIDRYSDETLEACKMARQARFEHGEYG